ncbi:hypothetical protein GJ744_008134, partial [Endocarpon pusillum]
MATKRHSDNEVMVDVLTDDLWRQMVTNINACPDQGGAKGVTSVAKLCHDICLRHVNRNPDSLGEEAEIKHEFEEVGVLLSTEGRALQNGDKEGVELAKRNLKEAFHLIERRGLETGSASGLNDEMFSDDNEGARPNLRPEAPELHKLTKEHKKFHRKAFPMLMECHKAEGSAGKQALRKKLHELNREITRYNNSSHVPPKTGCIDFDKVLLHWKTTDQMTRAQFRPMRKNSYMVMAGMQLPIGWGKRKPEDDRRYLSEAVVEKSYTE